MKLLPSPVLLPPPEVHVDRRVRRKILGKHAPSTAAAQNVEDRIDDPPQVGAPGSAARLGGWKQTMDDPPFRVIDVARISHGRTLARLLDTFQTRSKCPGRARSFRCSSSIRHSFRDT